MIEPVIVQVAAILGNDRIASTDQRDIDGFYTPANARADFERILEIHREWR